jgi:hypothetical protein
MGLLEKKAIKAFQDGTYKKLTDEINSIAGYSVEFDVDWDSLALVDQSPAYEKCFTQAFFTPIINAFKEITADDMGKEALKETLKKIVIKHKRDGYYASGSYSFADGVLTIDRHPTSSQVEKIKDSTDELSKVLMAAM